VVIKKWILKVFVREDWKKQMSTSKYRTKIQIFENIYSHGRYYIEYNFEEDPECWGIAQFVNDGFMISAKKIENCFVIFPTFLIFNPTGESN
jgi:hypothetical protein